LALSFIQTEIEITGKPDAAKMFHIIREFLTVSIEEIETCRKTFEICKFEAQNKERENKIIYLMELVKTSMNFTQSMRRSKSKFKKDFHLTKRKCKEGRGTTSYQGKYPKDQITLECPAETEEDFYYSSMNSKSAAEAAAPPPVAAAAAASEVANTPCIAAVAQHA
jgi:hypothetical protein